MKYGSVLITSRPTMTRTRLTVGMPYNGGFGGFIVTDIRKVEDGRGEGKPAGSYRVCFQARSGTILIVCNTMPVRARFPMCEQAGIAGFVFAPWILATLTSEMNGAEFFDPIAD